MLNIIKSRSNDVDTKIQGSLVKSECTNEACKK